MSVSIVKTGPEARTEGAGKRTPLDVVELRIQTSADAEPGRYTFRLVTPSGVSNALPIQITESVVTPEPEGSHETPETAVAVPKVPVMYTGKIARRGESDFYAIDVKAKETLTFQVVSGLPSLGAAGGNANGFDPSISIYEPGGSWFDSKRVNRIAFNDEPLWVLGRMTDAYLVQTFPKAGRYFVRIEAFSGQGGPDYSYQLKMLPGNVPQDQPSGKAGWEERTYQRRLSSDRLNELAERGAKPRTQKSIETYRAGGEFKLPATIEGVIATPGWAERARFHLDGPQDIAIEIETPNTGPPEFNPIVRLLDSAGEEVVTNIFAGRGACTGAMNKGLTAKTIVPMRNPGDYSIEIRDATSDMGGPDFRYRVQVRPQIPHIGVVKIDEDHINIAPGEAKTVRVTFDREEDYRDAVAVSVDSLPPGVQVLTAADYEPDRDPPANVGKRERYVARTERTVVAFAVAADAPLMKQPQIVRLTVRPIANGKPGQVIADKQILLMVVAKP